MARVQTDFRGKILFIKPDIRKAISNGYRVGAFDEVIQVLLGLAANSSPHLHGVGRAKGAVHAHARKYPEGDLDGLLALRAETIATINDTSEGGAGRLRPRALRESRNSCRLEDGRTLVVVNDAKRKTHQWQ